MPSTGLENILDSIRRESEEKIKRLWADFESKKNALVEETARYIRQFEEKNVHEVLEKMRKQEEKTESLAAMKYRNGILKAKLDIANRVLESAKKYILDLPADQYFDLVLKICAPHFSKAKSARLVFSREDFNRLSSRMKEKFLEQARKSGMELTIAESKGEQHFGGAKLDFSSVEENCTLDAIFDEHKDDLLSFLMDFLFTERQNHSSSEGNDSSVKVPENFESESFGPVSSDLRPEELDRSSLDKKNEVLSGSTESKEGLFADSLSSEKRSEEVVASSNFNTEDEGVSSLERQGKEKSETSSQRVGKTVKDSGVKNSKATGFSSNSEKINSEAFGSLNEFEDSFESEKSSIKKGTPKKNREGNFVPKNEVIPRFEQQEKESNRVARRRAGRPAKASKAENLKASKFGPEVGEGSKDSEFLIKAENSFKSEKSSGKEGTSKKSREGGIVPKNEVIPGFERQGDENTGTFRKRAGRSTKTSRSDNLKSSKNGSEKVASDSKTFDSANTLQGDLSEKSDLKRKSLSRDGSVVAEEKEKRTPKKKTGTKEASSGARVPSGKRAEKVENVKKNKSSEEV